VREKQLSGAVKRMRVERNAWRAKLKEGESNIAMDLK
jgi:hypothetical protein